MRAAQLDATSIVINYAEVVEFDNVQFVDPTGSQLGYTWNGIGQGFSQGALPVQVPQTVTAFQAKAALVNAGMYADVNAYMTASTTPIIDQLAWSEAANFNRTDNIIASLMPVLNLTSAQLDKLFIAAAQLNP